MLVFVERGKPEFPEKNLSEQSREPTNSAHIWRWVRELNPGHIGGRRALSPLRQPCSPICQPNGHIYRLKRYRPYRVLCCHGYYSCVTMKTYSNTQYDIEDKRHNTRPSSHVGRLGSMAAFSEIGKSASRSVSSSKFYLRMTVAWPLCLRHNIYGNEQEIFHNNGYVMFVKNDDCVTLGKL